MLGVIADSPSMEGAITLIGGGGHAKVVADAARAAGLSIAGFVDDDPRANLPGLEHLGPISGAAEPWIVCIGDVATRVRVIGTLVGMAAKVVHPSAILSPSISIGRGVFIGPAAVVNAEAILEEHAIINSGAIVEHDARMGRASHVAPGAVLCGGVEIGTGCLVGAGAVVLPGVAVGDGAVVGAGAVVRANVPARAVVVGVPARVVGA
ncbi:MAG: acetyltransferase [Phycisphaeraceae bacterium]|nr:acetyltransferase [Phycisphaeraceae bacterium]